MIFRLAIIILLLLHGFILWGQTPQLKILPTDQVNLPIKWTEKNLNTSYEIELALQDYVAQIQQLGFLSASVDSITGDTLQRTAHLYIGKKYEWVKIHTDSINEELLSKTGFRDKLFSQKPFSPKQISAFFQSTLTYLENNGYPFASIKLDHIFIENNQVEATVILNKNNFYLIDEIEILGEDTRLNRHYIENIIGIKEKQPYNERLIKNIGTQIRENPYMDELKPFEIIFTKTTSRLVLVLQPKKANVFDGIVGFQPQLDNQGVVVTGDVKVGLGNIIGQGERLNLRWQRLQDQTQEIETKIDIPFLFKTPIGFGYHLNIYRKDTTFNNVSHHIYIPFQLLDGSKFLGYFNQLATSIIATSDYENSTEIPPFNDVKNKMYGIGYETHRVQNKRNPYSGWTLEVQGGAGTNKIIPNIALEDVSYDSINLEASFFEGRLNFQYFQPVTRQTTLMLRLNAAVKRSDNLVNNQLHRIGGLNTLRGFDEQSIFASSFAIATLEYRLLFDENSRISIFYDQGWYEQSSITDFKTDTPFSIGAGITFGTNVGMFSLNYALGKEFQNPLNFKTGKIHFGFVNFF